MYIQKRTLHSSDLIDSKYIFHMGKITVYIDYQYLPKKNQLKASIPSTCSSVNISGHMFACNGKTATNSMFVAYLHNSSTMNTGFKSI